MNDAGLPAHLYRIWAGYIPDYFAGVPMAQCCSLIIIDVDHYKPTVASLAWACPRISRKGILALDDFLPASDRYASKAINEFLRQNQDFEQLAHVDQQLILRKR